MRKVIIGSIGGINIPTYYDNEYFYLFLDGFQWWQIWEPTIELAVRAFFKRHKQTESAKFLQLFTFPGMERWPSTSGTTRRVPGEDYYMVEVRSSGLCRKLEGRVEK